jgi:predicted transcriptional regulator
MQKLIINIGGDMLRDIKEVFDDPRKMKPGTHTMYLKTSRDLYEMLSPKRLDLLKYIIEHHGERKSISQLAGELNRKQEAVSRDTNVLTKYGLVKKIKDKKTVYLKALYGSLVINLEELVNRKLDTIDGQVRAGKRKLLNAKQALGPYAKR